jgi:hypothetical protein
MDYVAEFLLAAVVVLAFIAFALALRALGRWLFFTPVANAAWPSGKGQSRFAHACWQAGRFVRRF